jgi:predicted AAA+ superfamily ATPase
MEDPSSLYRLTIYRHILENPILQKALALLESRPPIDIPAKKALTAELQYDLTRWQYENALNGKPWHTFIAALLWEDENVFSLSCEKNQLLPAAVTDMLQGDLALIRELFHLDWATVNSLLNTFMNQDMVYPPFARSYISQKRLRPLRDFQNILEGAPPEEAYRRFQQTYAQYGCGKLAQNFAFHWQEALVPIENPVLTPLDTLIGYDRQKTVLCQNTRTFLARQPANHILLYGEKGTGKSTSVKALLHEFSDTSLRMIEISKHQIIYLHQIVEQIKHRGFRFILFIDDLSFEENETSYKDLKSFMEGSLETTPDNMLIYVTSNRRGIVKETWRDRETGAEELHISDTFQEKQSLADRFGITLGYYAPDQEEFLDIVTELAQRHHLHLPPEELRRQALQWERNYHGRSGRTAQQFIIHLLGELKTV